MLRWIMPCLVALFAIGTAAADGPAKPDAPQQQPPTARRHQPRAPARRSGHRHSSQRALRAASQLPPGLPRAHYKYRTTVAPPPHRSTCAAAGWWSRKRSRRAVHAVERGSLCPAGLRRAAAAGLLDAARLLRPSHSYSYDGPVLRRALYRLTGIACPTPAASTAIASALQRTIDVAGHREKPRQTGSADAITADLVAVLVAVTDGEPKIMTIANASALPSGPFEFAHRSLQTGLRAWVEAQTGHPLGYVEQLYTFADRGRTGDAKSPHASRSAISA